MHNLLQLKQDLENGKGLPGDETLGRPAIPAGQCKYIKEYKSKKDLIEIYSDIVDINEAEIIKNYYLKLGGDWIIQPVPTPNESDKTIYIPDHIDKDNEELMNLWERAIIQYLNSIYIYSAASDTYLIKQTLNPDWPFLSLYIDTINYNFWLNGLTKLGKLKAEYSKAPGKMVETQIDRTDRTGKIYPPYCDVYIPFNYMEIFGIPVPPIPLLDNILKLFEIKIPIFDPLNPGQFKYGWVEQDSGILTYEQLYKTEHITIMEGIMYIPLGITLTLEYNGPFPLSKDSILISRNWS